MAGEGGEGPLVTSLKVQFVNPDGTIVGIDEPF
jgi:hypothetical protein